MKKIYLTGLCVLICLSVAAQQVKISVAMYKDGKDCAASFTFDDGLKDNYTIAAPELEKRGWRGTFWLNCSKIPGEEKGSDSRMTWDDILDLHERGHEMSNHGWAHRKLTKIPYEDAVREIEKNDSAIFAHTGVRPVTYCYAYNAKNDTILALASKGRVGTRIRQYAFGGGAPDEQLRKRMDDAIRKRDWAIWMTHGIAKGYDHFKDVSRYPAFLDYVKERENSIWVGTFREVAAYIAERDAIKLVRLDKGDRISVEVSLDLDSSLYDMPLTMIVDGASKVRVRQDGKRLDVHYNDGHAIFDFNPYGGPLTLRCRR